MIRFQITDFWQDTFFPYVEKNRKASTAEGYKKLWHCYLLSEFSGKSLNKYRTSDATQLLTRLAESGLGSRTVAHVRSLMSGIFQHAVCTGLIGANPVREAKPLVKPARPTETTAYTLREIEQIIAVLAGNQFAQLAVALAAYAGLRPSEIAGLNWEDVQSDHIVLRRSVWSGAVSDTLKTEESAAKVPMISVVQEMLALIPRGESWVFCTVDNRPVLMDEFSRRFIAEPLREQGVRWAGLYACRRSCATIVTELTGSPWAAQAILRHTSANTTIKFYVRMNQDEVAHRGVAALEAAVQKHKALPVVKHCAEEPSESVRVAT